MLIFSDIHIKKFIYNGYYKIDFAKNRYAWNQDSFML